MTRRDVRTQNLTIIGEPPDSMDNWKTKFPLCQILCETFILGVFTRLEVHIVVPDLKIYRDEVDQGYIVARFFRDGFQVRDNGLTRQI